MDGGAWLATIHGVAKSWTRLSDFTITINSMNQEANCINAEDPSSIPGIEPFLPCRKACQHTLDWRISMDKETWWATVHGVTKSLT